MQIFTARMRKGEKMDDTVYRKDVIDTMEKIMADHPIDGYEDECQLINAMKSLPSAQPEIIRCEDADKLKRCRFEYINACKTVTYPTPDTSKNDIYDAHAVIKALHPIFGDEEL